MHYNQLVHHKSLPALLSSHQVLDASVAIHDLVSSKVEPLLASTPQYQAIGLTLDKVLEYILLLEEAQNKRRYKDTRRLRGIGGLDGKTGDRSIAKIKRELFNNRKATMRRFRQFVLLHDQTVTSPEVKTSVETLVDLLEKRVPRFEFKTYAESTQEFRHLIKSIEASPEALDAISQINLSELYTQLKQQQEDFINLRISQTELDAEREDIPKVTPTTRDLRHTVTVLLTMLHFDIESGVDTFRAVLGHVDEVIDKEMAVARSRRTIDANKKKAKDDTAPSSGSDDNGSSGETSETSDNSETPDTSDTPNAQDDAPSDTAPNPSATTG